MGRFPGRPSRRIERRSAFQQANHRYPSGLGSISEPGLPAGACAWQRPPHDMDLGQWRRRAELARRSGGAYFSHRDNDFIYQPTATGTEVYEISRKTSFIVPRDITNIVRFGDDLIYCDGKSYFVDGKEAKEMHVADSSGRTVTTSRVDCGGDLFCIYSFYDPHRFYGIADELKFVGAWIYRFDVRTRRFNKVYGYDSDSTFAVPGYSLLKGGSMGNDHP